MQFVDPYSKTHVNQKNNRISLTEMKRMGLEKADGKNFFESIIPLSNAPFHYILDGSKHSESEILESYLNNPVKYSAIKINANIEAQDTTLLNVAEMIKKIDLPVIFSDTIIDEYHIWKARSWGASSFCLDAESLERVQLQYLIEVGRETKMEPLLICKSLASLETALSSDGKVLFLQGNEVRKETEVLKYLRKNTSGRIFCCALESYSTKNVEMHCQKGYKTFIVKPPKG